MAMRISSPLDALLINLGRYVCPIYVKQDIRNQTPYLIGTGTLFKDGDESYLITAQHVIDGAQDERLIIAADNTFMYVYGEQTAWEYKQGKKINYDVCVIHLHPKIADRLGNFYRFTEPSDISDISEYDKLILYAFLGYPHTRNKPQRSNVEEVVASPYYYVFREFLDITKLNALDKNPTIHFALSAPFTKSHRPPDPDGISGGGVWKIELNRDTGLAHAARLVGIGIEHLSQQKAFIATKIHVAIYAQLMLKNFIKDNSS